MPDARAMGHRRRRVRRPKFLTSPFQQPSSLAGSSILISPDSRHGLLEVLGDVPLSTTARTSTSSSASRR
ncbi:hypothetical protein BL254_17840 [Protofrankia sp. BMG5.30]|nr:hypothetical protein BL254_17840 [Protofrankia sp. BMG5.30]